MHSNRQFVHKMSILLFLNIIIIIIIVIINNISIVNVKFCILSNDWCAVTVLCVSLVAFCALLAFELIYYHAVNRRVWRSVTATQNGSVIRIFWSINSFFVCSFSVDNENVNVFAATAIDWTAQRDYQKLLLLIFKFYSFFFQGKIRCRASEWRGRLQTAVFGGLC